MPELPEVETTRKGIEPYLQGQTIGKFIVREHRLRWPIEKHLTKTLIDQEIQQVARRGKYLLLHCTHGALIIHLGMSGSLRILQSTIRPNKHDHVDIIMSNNICLRYTDPRRFGCVLWTEENLALHPLLKDLGPEPLTDEFTGEYLFTRSKNKKIPIKTFLMDSKIVVGVGNIYANEALFAAKIHPQRSANQISKPQYVRLISAVKTILTKAIAIGGTTLRDFSGSDGKPGYFSQQLKVYGRGGKPCYGCKANLQEIRLGQRTTVFCPQCQV
jgi:formamidopyrimidine-DNA glycosylase